MIDVQHPTTSDLGPQPWRRARAIAGRPGERRRMEPKAFKQYGWEHYLPDAESGKHRHAAQQTLPAERAQQPVRGADVQLSCAV